MSALYNLESVPAGKRPMISELLKYPDMRHEMPTLSPDEVKDKLRALDSLNWNERQCLAWFHVLSPETSQEDHLYLKGIRICRPFFNHYLVGEVLTVN